MSFTAAQCRAARALIGWSQDQLAVASKVAKATIANFELGNREPYPRTLDDIRESLEAAGVEFTNGGQPGVRLRRDGHRRNAVQQTELYRDFVYSWQEPPTDGRGFVMNIGSEMPRRHILLAPEDTVRPPFQRLKDAKEDARRIIDAAIKRG